MDVTGMCRRVALSKTPLTGRQVSKSVASVSRRSGRCARSRVVATAAKPPSMQPSATELESLEELSIVVPDTLILEETSPVGTPKAATVTPNVLAGILSSPSGMRQYKNAVENAKTFDKDPERQLSKALANVGALFAEKVEGRVATEVDPRLARDTDAMVENARTLVAMYKEMAVPSEKTIIQLPATWEGIQAAKQLEKEGINTVVFLVYSLIQGIAAAQAGVSVIQTNMGRVKQWYNSHPGVIRDPKGPREDSGCASGVHPGQQLAASVYAYCKAHHPNTLVMVSGVRTKEDAISVAGCDYIILGPKVLKSLSESPTAQGYNDGLSAQTTSGGIPRALEASPPGLAPVKATMVTREEFEEGLGLAAKDLLKQGLDGSVSDLERLLPTFTGMTVGTE
ncbi:hypothetical protein BSKO_03701 [Bryopsis sp. KO-2023]|nr:hypothetical protein BSKO_03701 [Bryopsis sp. KO-2023]